MKTLRIEPFSGISGDMMLGALVDMGGNVEKLLALPEVLGIKDVTIEIGTANKCGIQCAKVNILDNTEPKARHLSTILTMIDAAEISPGAKKFAAEVFQIIGKAEAAIHGIPIEKVHFHEVGAIDSIMDIIGAAVLLDELNFDKVIADPVCTGSGFVKCDHGKLPVPAPATEKILQGMPTYPGDISSEMTTPTGAAILKALRPEFVKPEMIVNRSGYGAGSKDFEQPNCLRLRLGELSEAANDFPPDQVWLLQTNIDDTTGELLGDHFQSLLLQAGALDINFCALIMKKGRPGFRLEVLCNESDLKNMADIILCETTTIGVRYFPVQRTVLPRTFETVNTDFGEIAAKCVALPNGKIRKIPEYEDCRKCAVKTGASVQDVMREAIRRSSS